MQSLLGVVSYMKCLNEMKSPYGRPLLKLPWSVSWPRLEDELGVTNDLVELVKQIGWKRLRLKKGEKPMESDEKTVGLKDQLVVGFNKVCRSVRKGELSLAVFDQIALQPSTVGNTVGLLIHSCQPDLATGSVKNLSAPLAVEMGLKNVSAVGVKRDLAADQLVVKLLTQLKPIILESAIPSDSTTKPFESYLPSASTQCPVRKPQKEKKKKLRKMLKK